MEKNEKTIKSEPVLTKLLEHYSFVVKRADGGLVQMFYYSTDGWPTEKRLLEVYERVTKQKDAKEVVEIKKEWKGYLPIEQLEDIRRTQGESMN